MVRFLFALLGVVGVFSLCFVLPVAAADSSRRASGLDKKEATVQASGPSRLESVLAAAFPGNKLRYGSKQSARVSPSQKTAASGRVPLVKASAEPEVRPAWHDVDAGTFSAPLDKVLIRGVPDIGMDSIRVDDSRSTGSPAFRQPALLDRNQIQALLVPGDYPQSMGKISTSLENKFRRLEIEVSHSQHHLKLVGETRFGKKQVLYQCAVGLGSPEFPTPVGVYFVTHIYDENPWWIPPPNRAWAVGHSPSRKVYGGIMAPLLKKRTVRSRRKHSKRSEDKIAAQVRLEDYGYRFHGTNAPRSIGRNQSHGCVRMLPKDVKKIAALIKEYDGIVDRLESVNGSFVLLKSPIRLNLVK